MGGDMVVALGTATGGGTTLFGHNRQGPARESEPAFCYFRAAWSATRAAAAFAAPGSPRYS